MDLNWVEAIMKDTPSPMGLFRALVVLSIDHHHHMEDRVGVSSTMRQTSFHKFSNIFFRFGSFR
jgi:hypothetical protein